MDRTPSTAPLEDSWLDVVFSRTRGITDADLATWGAKYGNPKIFVSLVEWADRVITE